MSTFPMHYWSEQQVPILKLAVVGQKLSNLSMHKFLQTAELVTAAIEVINFLLSLDSGIDVFYA
jgi:hypothetical protein